MLGWGPENQRGGMGGVKGSPEGQGEVLLPKLACLIFQPVLGE